MNIKRALGITLLIYLASFVIGIITMVALGLKPEEMRNAPLAMCVVSFVAMAILATLGTLWYLKGKRIVPSWKVGLKFAIVGIVLSFVLDLVLFNLAPVPGESAKETLTSYYTGYLFWISLVIYVGAASLAGWWKSKKK